MSAERISIEGLEPILSILTVNHSKGKYYKKPIKMKVKARENTGATL